MLGSSQRRPSQNQDHPVLHETLTVIDEHITDLSSAPNSSILNVTPDSSSEYSSHIHDRLSYIQGEETDEEEDVAHTRAEVELWNADQVAEYLFTSGVEKKHCEVFRDQEISGEVLLGMDQSSLFLKAFDLGSVGRRLKTWQKVKSLQDEVNGHGVATRRNTQTFSDAGSEDSKPGRMRSRTNTLTSLNQRLGDRPPSSAQSRRLSQTPKLESMAQMSPGSPGNHYDSPTMASHHKRPSAASVRELHHSRRHSSTDYRLGGTAPVNAGTPKLISSGTFPLVEGGTHKKQPSFDRNWTMGTAASTPRPLSSTGFEDIANGSDPELLQQPSIDLDRGYFSGTEVDGRSRRNVLRKRDSLTSHSRNSSYAEQQRIRSATATARQSRYGSMDSSKQDSAISGTAQKHYGRPHEHRRTASAKTNDSTRQRAPTVDGPSPTVTKLNEADGSSPRSVANRQAFHGDWFSKPAAHIPGLGGLRAISDSITKNDRSKLGSPTDSSLKDSPRSSTPSAGPSFELDSPGLAKSPLSATTTSSRKSGGKKTKKDTSAYQRGLLKISPREAVKDSDYSGWMKKKSSHLMTTWKPRFFVLKGRRLAYYYSEDDTEEKGLIDISFHRVLSADTEKLQGLHATLTGASNTPIMPADSNLASRTDADAAAAAADKGADAMFIFKLVPPRAGLTKAVNFTKPMVHYFAVPNLQLGRAWMAALVKATIDRDETQPMTSSYQQKTISLTKARAMRHRPPALMNLEEKAEENGAKDDDDDDDEKKDGLGISFGEVDSAISGLGKLSLQNIDNASKKMGADGEKGSSLSISQVTSPQTA